MFWYMLVLEQAIIFALGGNTDVVQKLEGKGQKKLLKADCEPCFCIMEWQASLFFVIIF